MNTAPKSTKEAADKAEAAAHIPVSFAALYSKGVERIVQAQKTTIDLAAHQTTEIMDTCKKAMAMIPGMSGLYLFDLASQTINRGAELQKSILSDMLEQNAAIVDYAKNRYEATASKAPADVANLLQESMDRAIGMQKNILDFATQQNKIVSESVKQHTTMSGAMGAAAESVQKGVDTLIDTQRELLEIVSKPMKAAAKTA